jgi:hypothetical protein
VRPFSIVIPLVPDHDSELRRLFGTLAYEDDLIEEIIICRSETSIKSHPRIEAKFRKYARKAGLTAVIELDSIPEQAWDGPNRNRGIERARGELIAFIDADDFYQLNRLHTILKAFEASSCDAVLHNYELDPKQWNPSAQAIPIFNESTLEILSYTGPQDLITPIVSENGDTVAIHHAHLSVRTKSIKGLRYTARFPGADTEYCKKLILESLYIAYSPAKLSFWNRKRSVRYKFRLLKRKFS